MQYAFYIAAVLGAIGLYLVMPHRRANAKIGGLLALAALVGTFVFIGLALPWPVSAASIYYYIFTAIAAAAAVRVITHPRPVYSALYFVLVVLATSGMLIMLAAEFMAFAMVIIYGGAILVTYMFVIMLATQPQTSNEPETGEFYDREARSPGMAVIMGFALVALLTSVIFNGRFMDDPAADPVPRISEEQAWTRMLSAAAVMPGKFDADNPARARELRSVLQAEGLIAVDEYIGEVEVTEAAVVAEVLTGDPRFGRSRARLIEIPPHVVGDFVANIDMVGLALFESHTLGIELAAVVLLLSMVGAIVIARRQVPETPGTGVSVEGKRPERVTARI